MKWKFFNKQPKNSEEEETKKRFSFKQLKRWQLFALAGICIGIMSYMMYLQIASIVQHASAKTPLPTQPRIEAEIQGEETSKTEQYAKEQRNSKKEMRKEQEENNRLNRISMDWDRLYKQAKEAEEEAEVLPPEEPKARIHRVARQTRYRPPQKVSKPENKPKPEISFNLKKDKTKSSQVFKTTNTTKSIANVFFAPAVIFGEQKVKSGEVVRLRLTEAINLKGIDVPANTIITGTANIGQTRIKIQINQLRVGNQIIPVDCECYDLDHTQGLTYNDPKMAQQLRRDVAQDARRQVPHVRTGIPLVDPFLGTASDVVRDVVGNTARKSRSLTLSDNYHLLIKIQ